MDDIDIYQLLKEKFELEQMLELQELKEVIARQKAIIDEKACRIEFLERSLSNLITQINE